MSKKDKAPWEKATATGTTGKSRKLSIPQKRRAKAAAKKAGRPYPNLIDNMNAAKEKRT
jgi:hypothetical protein